MTVITSPKNELIKSLRKLTRKKNREEQQRYLLEGVHLVREAVNAQQPLTMILATTDFQQESWLPSQVPTYWVTPAVAQALGATVTTQGIFAVLPLPQEQLPQTYTGTWLLLDGVQDPGNIGTMARTADAAGLAGVVLGQGSADLYSDKVLRAMQGSHFHIPIYQGDLADWLAAFKAAQVPIFGSELNPAAVDFHQVPAQQNFALIMGNEGNGMQIDLLAQTDQNLYIPIQGRAESLNVAIAAGILLFQLKN
ncbi:TrmH family RNA methyltransferase [Loigolactobacillus zhaoyuanensis]|uniref:TrmH family RNA methyltransferase n=1 Tax=Loigolactobacillus zhaoyuanensis TaxID=2486017 RepID=UPI000F73EA1E|nr:RNA methyltransferase [Loigolactobacillus zhaoyuanensis]